MDQQEYMTIMVDLSRRCTKDTRRIAQALENLVELRIHSRNARKRTDRKVEAFFDWAIPITRRLLLDLEKHSKLPRRMYVYHRVHRKPRAANAEN